MAHMYRKLGLSGRTEAIVAAREMGMLPEATASRPAWEAINTGQAVSVAPTPGTR
jgi:hypothetical protein